MLYLAMIVLFLWSGIPQCVRKKATATNTALALLALLYVKSYNEFDYNFNTLFLIMFCRLTVALQQ